MSQTLDEPDNRPGHRTDEKEPGQHRNPIGGAAGLPQRDRGEDQDERQHDDVVRAGLDRQRLPDRARDALITDDVA